MQDFEISERTDAIRQLPEQMNQPVNFVDLLKSESVSQLLSGAKPSYEKLLPMLQIEGAEDRSVQAVLSALAKPGKTEYGAKELPSAKRAAEAAGWSEPQSGSKCPQQEKIANLTREVKDAHRSVDKSVANLKPALQEQFKEMKFNKNGNYSEEQLKFLKEHSKDGYFDALRHNHTNNSLREMSKPAENKLDKRLDYVNRELSAMPKEVQQKFKELGMVKDGVGYNERHVEVLRKNGSAGAADALQHYINERRRVISGGK